jgi:hypothetical protein
MAKEIDYKQLLTDILTVSTSIIGNGSIARLNSAILNALSKQGFVFKNGTIVDTEEKTEDDCSLKIIKDRFYVCDADMKKDNKMYLIKGHIYQALEDNLIEGENKATIETDCWEQYVHPWTIEDARNGDILCNDEDVLFLYTDDNKRKQFYGYSKAKGVMIQDIPFTLYNSTRPATDVEVLTFIAALNQRGYIWNTKQKQFVQGGTSEKSIDLSGLSYEAIAAIQGLIKCLQRKD